MMEPKEQTDPVAYEIAAIERRISRLAEVNQSLNLDVPSDYEKMLMNVYQMEQLEQEVKHLTMKQELRSRPRPAAERYLKLVWSRQ